MEETDRTSLVQQRIKKMLENKKKNAGKDDAEIGKRCKNGVQEEGEEESGRKPRSSIRDKRPVSAFKASESSQGMGSTTNLKA